MKFSALTERIQEKSDATDGQAIDPWIIHRMACDRVARGEPITVLSIGQEVHEKTPATIVNKAVESLQAGRHHYADIRGELKLREAIASYHHRLTGQQVNAEQITVFAGAQNALFSLAQILLEPGDEVILVAPYYTTYQTTVSATGARVVIVQVDEQDHYKLDTDRLIEKISPDTRVIVLNAPNNPMGSRYTGDQLSRILEQCVERNIWLILDTVYLDIVDPDSIELPHLYPGADKVLITIGSLSKSHRMTGWRMGWAVGSEALGEHLYNLSVCMHYGLPPFVMDAATHAIEQAANTPLEVRAVMKSRRELARQALQEIQPAELVDPEQGMFILINVRPLGMSAYEFAHALLEEQQVSVLPCDGFGPGGRYLVRIGLCVDGDELTGACQRIHRFINEHSTTA